MTEFFEGVPIEYRTWKDGKGADVKFADQESGFDYFVTGHMDIPLGRDCRVEIAATDNPHKWEIITCDYNKTNPQLAPPPMPINIPSAQRSISMPFGDFNDILRQRGIIPDARLKAIELAVKIYPTLYLGEKDPLAGCHTVIAMARVLESYLT